MLQRLDLPEQGRGGALVRLGRRGLDPLQQIELRLGQVQLCRKDFLLAVRRLGQLPRQRLDLLLGGRFERGKPRRMGLIGRGLRAPGLPADQGRFRGGRVEFRPQRLFAQLALGREEIGLARLGDPSRSALDLAIPAGDGPRLEEHGAALVSQRRRRLGSGDGGEREQREQDGQAVP